MIGKALFTVCLLALATQQAFAQTSGPTLKKYCPFRTFGGTGTGVKCASNWSYRGISYRNECTNRNHDRYWCATVEGNFRGTWGNCDTNENCAYFCSNFTTGGNANGAPCVFPFRYRGVDYPSCTTTNFNRLWCATTRFFGRGNRWGNCQYSNNCSPSYCTDRTKGGTAFGAPCVVPFTYKGVRYDNCTMVDHEKEWCSTDATYRGRWGNCLPRECPDLCTRRTSRGTAAEAPCVFPFTYRGVTYTRCTTFQNEGVFWCSTTPTYFQRWGNCIFAEQC